MPEHNITDPNAKMDPNVRIPSTVPSEAWLTKQVEVPSLASGARQTFVKQEVEPGELIAPDIGQMPVTPKAQRDPVAEATAQTATAQIAIAQDAIAQNATVQAATAQDAYAVEKIQADDQRVAEQGIVTTESTVRGQLEQLMGDVESGDAPWADEAMRKANQAMSARGMGSSSIAAAAITQSVLEAAMPIAQYDAGVYGTINIQNLRNRQETMLSNQAASNVAKNLNAKSVNEASQFMSAMRDNIIKFNASQQNAMSESNAARTTQVSLAGAAAATQVSLAGAAAATEVSLAGAATATQVSLANAAQINIERKFQDQRADEAERFNATNRLNIDKSNAEWRRSTNTANTAAENNTNMINAQNLFNISQQAQANLWQQSRDVFSWANQAATNEKDRAFKITMYALGRQDYLDDMAEDQRNQIRGGIAELLVNILGPMATKWAESPGND
jgi:hypothetical protein